MCERKTGELSNESAASLALMKREYRSRLFVAVREARGKKSEGKERKRGNKSRKEGIMERKNGMKP